MSTDGTDGFLRLSPDAAVVVDGEFNLLRCNERAEQLLSISARQNIGRKSVAWLSASSIQRLRQHLAVSGEAPVLLRTTGDTAGAGRRLAASVRPLPKASVGCQWLLTLREQLVPVEGGQEESLELSRLRQAVATRSIGIYEHDHQANELYGSPEVRQHYGLTLEQSLSIEAFAQATHADDADFLVREIAKAHDPAGDGVFDVRHRILTPSGEVRWLHTMARTSFLPGDNGAMRLNKTLGSSIVVTKEHQNELSVRRLAAILDTTPDVVATTDLDGSLTYLNESGRQHANWHPDAPLKTRRIEELLAPQCQRAFQDAFAKASEEGIWRGELLWRSGRERHLPVSVVMLAHQQTRSSGAYLSILARDLTEQKALEAKFLHAQKLEAVGQLAGGIAHDFNNLLSVVFGFASLIRDGQGVPEVSREHSRQILRAGERAAELTCQLLSFSRKQISMPRVFDVHDVLRSLGPMIRRLVAEPIEVVTLAAEEELRVKADPHQVEQALMNLVINARDAMPTGGVLTVAVRSETVLAPGENSGAEEAGTFVCLSVSDTGPGMSPELQARVFEPFFTTKEQGQGTGLGLSTALGIAQQNGGSLSLESALGCGTTFTLRLPATDADFTDADKPLTPSEEGARGRGERILVVEDEAQLREVVVRILEAGGYRTLVATGPEQALRLIRCGVPKVDAVLTDIVMPGMNGKEMVEAMAVAGHRLPTLFMSGYSKNVVARDGVVEEGLSLLLKPFTPSQLLSALGRVVSEYAPSSR